MLLGAFLLTLPLANSAAPIVRVDTHEKAVALTFDACATRRQSNGFDRGIFEYLKDEKLKATVFVTGTWVGFHPREARQLAALETIALGNHSQDHRTLTKLTLRQVRDEVDRANAAIVGLGREAVAFRPPSGAWDERCVHAAAKDHLPTILWDVVPGDPGPVSAKTLIKTIVARVRPGSIVVMHVNGRGRHTAEALPVVVSQLRERGYRFVTVPELLALPDARPVRARRAAR
jgi:peptidoglycan-N-acetylglucosamine deacetylase